MGKIVYAKEAAGLFTEAGTVSVARGQAWDADSAVVKANPALFEDEPTKVEGRPLGGVERATRAPGEKRGPGRPRKTAE